MATKISNRLLMKKWIQKAIVQKAISFLPCNYKINYIFQRFITNGVALTDEYFTCRLQHAGEHLRAYQKFSSKPTPEKCLEIGTGWYPIIPVAFFISGSAKIYSVDLRFLTTYPNVVATLKQFVLFHDKGILSQHIKVVDDRIELLRRIASNPQNYDLQRVLCLLNICYLVGDARNLALEDDSIDLVNSNNTFEHIYPPILIPILKECRRVVDSKNGVMSHFIDMSDHFAHFDNSISIYNFLRFSDSQWSWIDNSIQPQNRLRINDYKAIFADLKIPISEESIREGNVETLGTIPLNERFTMIPPEILAVSHCCFVSDMKRAK